jgi:hypothetical protein
MARPERRRDRAALMPPSLALGQKQPIAQDRPQHLARGGIAPIIGRVCDKHVTDRLWRVQHQLLAPQEAAFGHRQLVGRCAPELQRVAPQHKERLGLAAQVRGQRRCWWHAGRGAEECVWHWGEDRVVEGCQEGVLF